MPGAGALFILVDGDVSGLEKALKKALKTSQDTSGKMAKSMQKVDSAVTALKRAVVLLAGAWAVREIVRVSDAYTLLDSKLKLVTDSTAEAARVHQRLFEISQETGTSFRNNADTFVNMQLNIKDVGVETETTLQFLDTWNKALIINGSTMREAASSTLQMKQALASGRLAGEEFRGVSEGNAFWMTELAKATNIEVGELRTLSHQQKLTREFMLDDSVITKMATSVSEKFGGMTKTIERANNEFQNVFEAIWADTNKATAGTERVAGAISDLALTIDQNRDSLGNMFATMLEQIASLVELLPGFAKHVTAVFDALDPWVWEVGLIAALVGGKKGKLAFAALAGLAEVNALMSVMAGKIDPIKALQQEIEDLNIELGALEATGMPGDIAKVEAIKELIVAKDKELGTTRKLIEEQERLDHMIATSGETGKRVYLNIDNGQKNAKKSAEELSKELWNIDAALEEAFKEVDSIKAVDDALTDFFEEIDNFEPGTIEDIDKALTDFFDDIDDKAKETTDALDVLWTQFVENTGDSFEGLFKDVLTGELDTFQDVFEAFGDTLLNIWIDLLAKMAANSLINALGMGATGSLSLQGLFGGAGYSASTVAGGGFVGWLGSKLGFGAGAGAAPALGSGTAGAWMGGGAGAAATGVTLSGSAGATTMGGAAGADLLGVGGAGLGGMAAAGAFAAPIVLGFIDAMTREKPRLEDALTTNMLQPFELAAEGMSDEFGPLTKSLGEATIQFNSLDAASIDASAGVLAMGKNVLFAAGTTDEFSGTMLESIQVYDAATGSWQNAEVSIHDLMLRMDELKDTTDLTTSEIAGLVAQEAGLASLSDELTSSYQAQQAALNALGPAVRNVAETVLNATGSMRLAAQVAYQSTSSDSIHHGQPLGSYAVGTDFVPMTGIYQLHRGEAVLSSQENQSRQQPGSVNVQVFIGNKEFEGDMRVVADEVHTEKARRGITDRRVYR